MEIINFLQYSFIQKAFLAGSFVAVLCAVLGMFLVLKKMSLIGDGLSHVSFGGIALGMFLGIYPLYIAIPVAVLSSYLILKITKKAKIYGDSAIGIVSAVGLSFGILLASLSRGFNVDLFSYLFGNILAISNSEVIISIILSTLVAIIIYLFYHELFSATFDEEFATASGIKTNRLNTMLAILTAITVVLSIKIVGVMLVSALLIIPASTALQINKSFKGCIFTAIITSILSVLIGITLSFFLDLPAGATIVLLNFFLFGLAFLKNKLV